MITVAILINGQPIFTRTAVRVEMKNGMGYYKCDDGMIVQHRYSSGAVPLAQKLLKTIKEPKHDKTPKIKPRLGVGLFYEEVRDQWNTRAAGGGEDVNTPARSQQPQKPQ